jgi:hypothetical protein
MTDEQRITEALENASATIKNLRNQLNIALDTLEYYADTDPEEATRFVAMEALDKIAAVSGAGTVQ